ncbi:MAG: MFS transporter [bacterium]|nr:MFS transporter [bacterium]
MTGAPTTSVWRKDVAGWALYDFANTIYSMNIVSLYLKRYVVEDLGYDDRYFDVPFSMSMLIAAVLLPALGAMSDHSTKKKIFLFLFTLTCCSAVGLMAFVPSWALWAILLLFIIANFSYEAGQPFYNSLLYSVAEGVQARFVSGIGVAAGYVGSIVGMLLVLPFVTGECFGFELSFLSAGGKQASFLPTAFLFMIFALPVFLWVREKPVLKAEKVSIRRAYRDVWEGLRQTKKYPGVLRFLVADYFVEDAVTTVILNIGLYCSLVLGLAEGQITTFLVVSTITAVLGSFIIGYLAKFWSLKRLLYWIIGGWLTALILFAFTDNMIVVWILGSVVGVLLGGLWTTTRPLLAELVPREELGRFFGLFSLSGRAAAVVGPLVWTAVVYLFNPERTLGRLAVDGLGLDTETSAALPYKAGILSLVLMITVGLVIFRKVPDTGSVNHG